MPCFLEKLDRALFLSPTKNVLVEESLLGWKEFELEVIRDRKDNVIIVCSIENKDKRFVFAGTIMSYETLGLCPDFRSRAGISDHVDRAAL